jgi:hypothetical protein
VEGFEALINCLFDFRAQFNKKLKKSDVVQ